jgi:hypothetical protein
VRTPWPTGGGLLRQKEKTLSVVYTAGLIRTVSVVYTAGLIRTVSVVYTAGLIRTVSVVYTAGLIRIKVILGFQLSPCCESCIISFG